MSKKKLRVYFPNYQLRHKNYPGCRKGISFNYKGVSFETKMSFGATETQKVALNWAASHNTPPVICVTHEAPKKPDQATFHNPLDLFERHQWYLPYAMVIATLECLGEEELRKIKIYFCDVQLHEDNAHVDYKGTCVVSIK